MPTVAALLGTTPPATAVGRPLREALAPSSTRPRVVALLALDGTRADYFDTYQDVMPTLSRLRAGGAWYSQAHVSSVPTLTAVGHANLGTGAEPRTHGLAVNYLFNRVTGKSQEAYDGLDPGELMALTMADAWNIATEGRAVIIGQGGAIRAVAGLVGHGGCLVNGRKVRAASFSTAGDGTFRRTRSATCCRTRCSRSPRADTGPRPAARGWATTSPRPRSSGTRRCSSASRVTRSPPSSRPSPLAPTTSPTWCWST